MVTPCKASWDRLLVALKPFRGAAGPEGEELRKALDGHFPGVDWDDDPQPGDTTAEEQAWIMGSNFAYSRILGECVRHLYGEQELKAETLLMERTDAVAALREVCQLAGDNDWEDSLRLADIVEKHLRRHLDSGDHAFVTLNKVDWGMLVALVQQQVNETPVMAAPLLKVVRDDARVPDGWLCQACKTRPATGSLCMECKAAKA